jgi:uncharacterized membrane protein YfcA
MFIDGYFVLGLLALGSFTGFAAGLLGVGGGMMTVPFITILLTARHFPESVIVHVAIATSLGIILFTSISSVRAHHRHGAVLWAVVKVMAPGILIGSWVGPWIGSTIPSPALALFFSVFVGFSATQMLIDRKPKPTRELPKLAGMMAVGVVIGVISGLVGAGGGFLTVPFLVWCNVRMQNAVATSAALGFPIALAGTLSNIYFGWQQPELPEGMLGYLYLPALVSVAAASVVTAPLGAKVAHALPVKSLKRVFALMLYGLAAYMLWRGLRAPV